MVELYWASVASNHPILAGDGGLPPLILERIGRFKRPADRATRNLAYRILAEALKPYGASLNDLTWDSHGRPALANIAANSQLDFNFSHSGSIAAVVVSDHGRVGVDIEAEREVDLDKLRQRFTAEQWAWVNESTSQKSGFFKLWTSIEAVLKAHGTGIAGGLGEVFLCHDKSSGSNGIAQYKGKRWYLTHVSLAPGYHCCTAQDIPSELRMRPLVGNGP